MQEDFNLFRDMTLKILEAEVAPHYEEWEKAGIMPRAIWDTMAESGLLGVDLPEEYGGVGATLEISQMIITEMARLCYGGLASAYNIQANIVIPYIFNLGTEEQKMHWLPKMCTGETVGAIAMTEPGMGSDLSAMKTRAVKDGNEWVINGSKTFITNGIHANLVIVCAKTDVAAGAKGISLFLVDASLSGFSRGQQIEKIGQHTSDTAELFFEDLRVSENALLGRENAGFAHLMTELPRERMGCSSQALGACLGSLEVTIAYVNERKAFGKNIAQFQNTRFKLAELKAQYELSKAFYEKCVDKFSRGEMTIEDAALMKLTATEAQCTIADECLQFFGGYGYTVEYPISRFYTDARVQKIYAGTSEIMKEVIARGILGR